MAALFDLDGSDGFYALPFPNDLRRNGDGTIDFDDHIRPNPLIDRYLTIFSEKVDGFGTNSAIFVRFSDEIDTASLPASTRASLEPNASVYLVDVDPSSPERGRRWPLRFRFEPGEGESIGPHWLSCLPYPGFPLRPSTTYALVVTGRLLGFDGLPVRRSADMDAVLAGEAAPEYARLLEWLDEPGDDERGDVASAAVFTTQDPTALVARMAELIRGDVPPPVPRDVELTTPGESYSVYEGVYDSPNFQTGEPPYDLGDGEILIDPATGDPVVQRTEELRFALSVPPGDAPATGWPVVLYAHGTGGSYRSFVANKTALRLAQQGLAVLSIDQPLHGPRAPDLDPTDQVFFDYQNPVAGRGNSRQAAADYIQLVRLVTELDDLDGDRISFMGHSQGGMIGSLFLAHEPRVEGAVLSGAGGLLYQTLLYREDIRELVNSIIRDYPLDEFNNMFALVQMFVEPVDPANCAPMFGDKNIYQSEGLDDSYTPVQTIEALGVAIGGDLVTPVIQDIEGFELAGLQVIDPPVTGNRGGYTSVLVQYRSPPGRDGHFVVFDVAAARRQHAEFLGTLARDGIATLVP